MSNRELFAEPLGIDSGDAEIAILRIFKKNITDKNYTPTILELAASKTCTGISKVLKKEINLDSGNLVSRELDYKLYEFADDIENKIAHDKISYCILEQCEWRFDELAGTTMGTVADEVILASLLFQLIHGLYVINTIYPLFRHRDLHPGNVMVKVDINFTFDPKDPQVIVLQALGKKFYVPFFGMYIKIIDFGHSILPEENIYSSMAFDKNRFTKRTTHDISLFFHWLYRIATGSNSSNELSEHFFKRLLESLDPAGLYYNYDVKHIDSNIDSAPTYTDLLNNYVFEPYLSKGRAKIYKEYSAAD